MKIKPPPEETSKTKALLFWFFILVAIPLAAWFFLRNFSPAPRAVITFQSFAGSVEVSPDGANWKKPVFGETLKPFAFLKTGTDGEIDLKYGDSSFLRLKENSRLQYASPSGFSKASGRIHLENGRLLLINKNGSFQVTAAQSPNEKSGRGLFHDRRTRFINIMPGAYALISASPEKKNSAVNVLRGQVTVSSVSPKYFFEINESETAEVKNTGSLQKNPISQADWKQAGEIYELTPKTASTEAAQADLAKKTGSFFDYVFDHGTFFQQKWGWCEREFIAPEDNSPVYMEATYDVFPKGSWVGVYLKTRNLDLSKFKGFKLEARRIPGRPHPDIVKLEFKSKSQVVQAYVLKMLRTDWETIEFPVHLSNSTMANELTIIFSNDKVGNEKSGGLQIRNFTLIPRDKPLEAKGSAPPTASSKTPVTTGVNASAITKN